MGTAGGIRHAARGRVSETFLALNGDVLADAPLADLVALHRDRAATATIALAPVADPSRYGLVRADGEGRVLGFLEKPQPEEIDTDLINAGTYVLPLRRVTRPGREAARSRSSADRSVARGRRDSPGSRRRATQVRRRHAGELYRGPPRPPGRAHPLALTGLVVDARWVERGRRSSRPTPCSEQHAGSRSRATVGAGHAWAPAAAMATRGSGGPQA